MTSHVLKIAYLARYVGAEGIGKLSTATALNGLLVLLLKPGLDTLLIRDIAADIDKVPKYVGNMLCLKLLLGIPFALLAAIVAHVARYSAGTVSIIGIYTLVYLLDSLGEIFLSLFRAHQRMEYEVAGVQFVQALINFSLSLHAIVAGGLFRPNGTFHCLPKRDLKELEEIFRCKILVMLKREGKIGTELIEKLMGWRHSGFSVHAGNRIAPKQETLAQYILRNVFPEQKITYIEDLGIKSKSGVLQSMATRTAFLQSADHRIRFVYTPKHALWLKQVEIWFSILVRKLLRRASFASKEDLRQRILAFIDYFNATAAQPFKWAYAGRPLSC
jgi:transposase